MATTSWRKVAISMGAILTGLGAAWFVTWGAVVAATDLPQSRPFWIAASFILTAAFIVGLILLVVGERTPPDRPHNSTFAERHKARKTAEKTAEKSFDTTERKERGNMPKVELHRKPSVSPSEQILYGSLARSLQAALTEGTTLKNRLDNSNVLRTAFIGISFEMANDEEVDAWIEDVRSRLQGEPMLLDIFEQANPHVSTGPNILAELAQIRHRRYWDVEFRLQQLEKIIRKLEQ